MLVGVAMKRYEFAEHTADIFVRGYGDTIENAFAAVGEGMFALMTDRSEVAQDLAVELTVESIDLDALLVTFLSKLILVFEVDGIVLGDLTVMLDGTKTLHAVGRGEKFDRAKHGHGIVVKGASYHMLSISSDQPGEFVVQVLLDI
jgi:SHS2 domain-containing protein